MKYRGFFIGFGNLIKEKIQDLNFFLGQISCSFPQWPLPQ